MGGVGAVKISFLLYKVYNRFIKLMIILSFFYTDIGLDDTIANTG